MARTKRISKMLLGLGAVVVTVAAIALYSRTNDGSNKINQTKDKNSSQLQLISQVFRDGAAIPPQYTCKGQNVSPPLTISGVPAGAKSLALILHDPDAVGSDFTHWVVYDMPASTGMIAANSVPVGALQGVNGAGRANYMGPCPPAGTGTHRYLFELYALDKTLGLNKPNRGQLESAIKGHQLAHAVLTGLFSAN